MVMDYTEELTAGNPRHASIIKIKTGVKKNGTIVAHHIDFMFDSGAYASMKPAGYLIGASTCAGPPRGAARLLSGGGRLRARPPDGKWAPLDRR